MLDLRIPSGFFFLVVGLILCGFGVFAADVRADLTDINVNLYCGIMMVGFGAGLLLLARRSA